MLANNNSASRTVITMDPVSESMAALINHLIAARDQEGLELFNIMARCFIDQLQLVIDKGNRSGGRA